MLWLERTIYTAISWNFKTWIVKVSVALPGGIFHFMHGQFGMFLHASNRMQGGRFELAIQWIPFVVLFRYTIHFRKIYLGHRRMGTNEAIVVVKMPSFSANNQFWRIKVKIIAGTYFFFLAKRHTWELVKVFVSLSFFCSENDHVVVPH